MRNLYVATAWACVYLLLTIWLLGSVFAEPTSRVATGYTRVNTVQQLNMWVIWWNSEQLKSGFSSYWDAPIFYPTDGTLAFSEPQPATVLLAPVYQATGSLPLVYNIWVAAALNLNAVSTRWLLKAVGVQDFLAGCGGFAALMLPAVFPQLDGVQIIHFWPQTVTIILIHSLLRCPTWWKAIGCGLMLTVCFLVSIHQGLLFVVLLTVSGWFLLPVRKAGWLKHAVCAVIVAAAFLIPFGRSMNAQMADHEFERTAQTIRGGSARLHDYLQLPTAQIPTVSKGGAGALCPGTARSLLALFAVTALASRRRRWWVIFFLVFGTAAVLLSLGTNLTVAGWQPWRTLITLFPILHKIRSVKRFAFFAQLAVVWLCFITLHHLSVLMRQGGGLTLRRVVLVICAVVAVLETPPPQIPVADVPTVKQFEWARTLRKLSDRHDAVWCLPMSGGPGVHQMSTEATWMHAATVHGRPIVNGYSGFYPDSYLRTARRHTTEPLSIAEIDRLQATGVTWLVMTTEFAETFRGHPAFQRLQRMPCKDADCRIYRIRPRPASDR